MHRHRHNEHYDVAHSQEETIADAFCSCRCRCYISTYYTITIVFHVLWSCLSHSQRYRGTSRQLAGQLVYELMGETWNDTKTNVVVYYFYELCVCVVDVLFFPYYYLFAIPVFLFVAIYRTRTKNVWHIPSCALCEYKNVNRTRYTRCSMSNFLILEWEVTIYIDKFRIPIRLKICQWCTWKHDAK